MRKAEASSRLAGAGVPSRSPFSTAGKFSISLESVIGLYMHPVLFLCPCTLLSLSSASVEEVWEGTWEGCGCRGVGVGQVGLREAGRPQTRHIPPAQHPLLSIQPCNLPGISSGAKPPPKTIAHLGLRFTLIGRPFLRFARINPDRPPFLPSPPLFLPHSISCRGSHPPIPS